jgi:ligand-binding sensor domain-containing protein
VPSLFRQYLEDLKEPVARNRRGFGLNKIDKKTGEITHFTKPKSHIPDLQPTQYLHYDEYEENNLWIGGYRGCIVKYNLVTKRWKQYIDCATNSGQTTAGCKKILEDSKKRMWIATNGNGLCFMIEIGQLHKHTIHQIQG